MSTNVRLLVGVDVSKDVLDAYARPANLRQRFANDAAGIAELVAWVKPLAPNRIVFESTKPLSEGRGGRALLAEGALAVVVNARQVRDFAKGTNQLAKTDAIDTRDPGPLPARWSRPPSVRWSPRTSLNSARFTTGGQLVRMLAVEKNHRHAARGGSARCCRNIERHIGYLQARIAELEDRMDGVVQASAAFRAKDDVLQSVVGIGPQVSRTLLAHLPELGQKTRQGITALVGLSPTPTTAAPRAARHIRGGRSKVRIGLYQAAVAAIRRRT